MRTQLRRVALSAVVLFSCAAFAQSQDAAEPGDANLEPALALVDDVLARPTPSPTPTTTLTPAPVVALTPTPTPVPSPTPVDSARLQQAIKFIREEYRNQQSLRGSVGVQLMGDDASQRFPGSGSDATNVYKVGVDLDLHKGTYPEEIRLRSATSLQIKDGAVQEDVTKILVNYDRHFAPWIQTYGFIERFSDSYMAIQQRYEAGFGVLLDYRVGRTRNGKKREEALRFLCAKDQRAEKALEKSAGPDRARAEAALAALKNSACTDDDYRPCKPSCASDAHAPTDVHPSGDLRTAIRERYSLFEFGLALSVFWELEHAELDVFLDRSDGGTTMPADKTTKLSVPGERRLRWTARPTIKFRPHDDLTLTAMAYCKFPLGDSRRTYTDASGNPFSRFDWRFEPLAKADVKTGERATITVQWEWRYDAAPPQLSADTIAQQRLAGYTVRNPIARDRHGTVSLKLSLKL